MKKVLPLIILSLLLLVGCGKEEDTPELALEEIKQAIETCDQEKFAARVDEKFLLEHAYDDAATELVLRAREFRALYPNDPFFRNDPEFIMTYIDLNRAEHMKFVEAVVEECFNRTLQPPAELEKDTISGTASELRYYYATANSVPKKILADEHRASARFDVSFESLYAKKKVVLPLELELEKEGERWRLKRIKNVGEMIDPLVEIAEILWPDQFNF